MFKLVFFLWRRHDFSHEQYRDYYENIHAVLGSTIALPRAQDFRRNYPLWPADLLSLEKPAVFGMAPFDSMTELWHASRSNFDAQVATVTRSPVKEQMAEDELRFLDREQQILLVVDEVGASTKSPVSVGMKLVHYACRNREIDSAEFRRINEEKRVPRIASQMKELLEYRRSYPLFDEPLSYVGGHHNPGRPDSATFPLDVIEEFWLPNMERAGEALKLLNDGDEINDPLTSIPLLVSERRSDFGEQMAPVARY